MNFSHQSLALTVTCASSLVLSLSVPISANAMQLNFQARLSGDQEVPPVVTTAEGSATGTLTGGPGSYVFTYEIDYAGLSSPIAPIGVTGGHIHNAPAGVNGSVVHFLDTDFFDYTGTTAGTIMGDWRFDDATNPLTDLLVDELKSGNLYFNLHTENFNGGEIRGQINSVPEPSMVLGLGFLAATAFGLGQKQRQP
ncbi:MAG: CHRD domain-containing protein [Crocosphaera sp.]|nr:CHRD domain-containing protein [Crocosphaera sp.]